MGNAESTSRIVAMQRGPDGDIQVSEDVLEHLKGNKGRRIRLDEGEQIVHVDQLQMILEEGKHLGSKKFKTEIEKLKAEKDTWLAQQAQERKQVVADTELKWKHLLEETTEKEKEALRVQLEEEEKQKIDQLEAYWKLILEEAKKEQKDALSAQFKAEEEQKLAEVGDHHTIQDVTSIEMQLQQLQNEKEALRLQLEEESNQKLEEVETKWQHIFQEASGICMLYVHGVEEAKAVLADIDARWMWKLEEKEKEHVDEIKRLEDRINETNLSNIKASDLEQEEAVNGMLQKLQEEKEALRLLLGQIEEEGRQKLEEVDAKWQQLFQEATGKDVHIDNVEEGKAIIDEIEARWMSKMEERETEHMDKVKSIEEDHISEIHLSDSKFLEQEKLVNAMLQKLEQLESREDGIRQQFISSALNLENQLRPHKQKAVCIESRNIVLNCYKENKNQPLRCSEEVKKFMDCVESERIALLQRNAAK